MTQYVRNRSNFINPYNFVPVDLRNTGRANVAKRSEELLTGYFQCRVRCRTPLAIPDVEHREDLGRQHYKYPFFSRDGSPVIPGSAVRGVIRSVYETITDSCFGSVQGNPAVTARSSKAFKPGLLVREKSGWKLYQAKKYLVVVDRRFYDRQSLNRHGIACCADLADRYKTGAEVCFEPAVDQRGNELQYVKERNGRRIPIGSYVKRFQADLSGSSMQRGYICIGEKSPKRHFQGIFQKGAPAPNGKIAEADIQKLEDVLEEYRDERKNKLYPGPHKGYPDYAYAKKNGVIPVYYSVENNKLYMTFAALGRKAYNKRWNDLVSEKAHDKCDRREHLCPACALFGTAEGDKFGSRVRFTDAKYTGNMENCLNSQGITFGELGSPRPSYIPFYLRETGTNADYSVGYDSNQMEIRGRKFYWHHEPDTDRRVTRNNRNATFETVRKNAEFGFRIYFDGITRQQMELLAMAVHLNENDLDGHMCHKIGHGKPLGYGSVKICIEKCMVRKFDPEEGWREDPMEIPCGVTCHTCKDATLRALKTICDFDILNRYRGVKVEYPEILLDEKYKDQRGSLNENVLASHRWFTQNYRLGSRTPERKLPEITDHDLRLQKYTATQITDRDVKNDRRGQGRR